MSKKIKVEVLTNRTFINTSDGPEQVEQGSVIEISQETFDSTPASHFRVVSGEAPKSKAKAKAAEAPAEAEAPKGTAPSRTPKEESAPVMPSANSAPAKG